MSYLFKDVVSAGQTVWIPETGQIHAFSKGSDGVQYCRCDEIMGHVHAKWSPMGQVSAVLQEHDYIAGLGAY